MVSADTNIARREPSSGSIVKRFPLGLAKLGMLFGSLGLAPQLLGQTRDPAPRSAEIRNPREMLQIVQIDQSQLGFLEDDRPLVADERETLLQLLYRLPMFAQADVDRWSQPLDNWKAAAADLDSYRFEMFDVRGQVVELKRISVLPELAPRLRFEEYFELRIKNEEAEFIVYVRQIPARWQQPLTQGVPIHEPVRLQALLLKRAVVDGSRLLVFAANRTQWRPTQPSAVLGVSPDEVTLAGLQMDTSLLSDVRHKSRVGKQDRECFYQMLSATRLSEPEQLARLGRHEFDIARMIRTPQQVSGELYTLQGLARRAIEIHIPDEDIRQRFGLDHYYELEVFLPLKKQVRFVDAEDAEGKLFTEYPFVICVSHLPDGMETGDDIRFPVSFSGFFMKLYAYQTEFMSSGRPRSAAPRLQLSPLFIGPTVVPVLPPVPRKSRLDLAFAVFFVVGLLAIWLLLWRASVKDKQQTGRLFRKHALPADGFDNIHDEA